MTDNIISLRVDRKVYNTMRLHDDINWSSILRKSIDKKLESFEEINKKEAKKAVLMMNKIRKSKTFAKGKEGVEIIREWRKKRR